MPRRVSKSQIQSQIRRAQQQRRQAVNQYNAAVRKHNADNRKLQRAVSDYNRAANAYNQRVRDYRSRLRREIQRQATSAQSARYTTYSQSVSTLSRSFDRVDDSIEQGSFRGRHDLLGMMGTETANSVALLNALSTADDTEIDAEELDDLRESSIRPLLEEFDRDLAARWDGALFALNPRNPDAARHFCTSARELVHSILNLGATDDEILSLDPSANRTDSGHVTRRARVRFYLKRQHSSDPDMQQFVEDDVDNVLTLFRDFNDGTHGSAGTFPLNELRAIKVRVEDAVRFLREIISPTTRVT